MNRCLLVILLFLLCAVPATILSAERVTDAYYDISLASVNESLEEGKIAAVNFGDFSYDPNKEGHLGYQSMIIAITHATGISVRDVAFLPIGGFIIPFMFFCFALKLFRSYGIAAAFALFMAFDPSLVPGHYSVFAYTWERALFLSFLMIAIFSLNRPTHKRWRGLIIIVFVGTFSLYWTTPFLMIFFLISVSIVCFFDRKLHLELKEVASRSMGKIAILCLAIYLAFSKVLYNDFLPAVLFEKYGSPSDALGQLLSWMSIGKPGDAEDYALVSSGVSLYDTLLIARYLLILTPIIVFIIWGIFKRARRKASFDIYTYMFWSIMIVGVSQAFAYAAIGHLSLRYVSLFFLPLTIISLERMRFRKIRIATLAILLLLVMTAFGYLITDNDTSLNRTRALDNGAVFLYSHSGEENVEVLMDLNTFGVYLLEGVDAQIAHVSIVFYDSSIYSSLVETSGQADIDNLSLAADYVVINLRMAGGVTAAPNWRHYEPLDAYLEDIRINTELCTVLDDGNSWIISTERQ